MQSVCGEAISISLDPILAVVALAASHPRPLLGFSNPLTERERGSFEPRHYISYNVAF